MAGKRVFVVVWSVLAALKIALVIVLPLFGDEAFYWWESRHPAWSYSDLPPLTAWLIALGSAWIPGEIGVRLPFLLLGLWLPWQLRGMARRWYGDDVGWQAGLLALLMPISALLGVLALPDVVMAVATLATVDALVRAGQSSRVREWLLLGVWLAIGVLCHYRFLAVPLVLAIMMWVLPTLRRQVTQPGPWLAALIAAVGVLPLVIFNLGNDLTGLRFQFVDRHPWAWQWSGLWQIPEQLLIASPVLLLLLGWFASKCLRRMGAGNAPSPGAAGYAGNAALAEVDGPSGKGFGAERIVVPFACTLWLLFFVLGFFADSTRFRWHWPLPALLLLLPLLAARWSTFVRAWRIAALVPAVAISTSWLAWLALAARPDAAGSLAGKLFPDNFTGWREVAGWLAEADDGTGPVVVDNFMLAAELAFYAPESVRQRLRVLDDPRNQRHGRAAQLHLWSLDEAALANEPARPGWIVVEEGARRFSDRFAWYQSICQRFAGLKLDDVLDLHDGRRRFVRWRHDGYRMQDHCDQPAAIPPLGWFEVQHAASGAPDRLGGWAVQSGLGIERIELLLDGVRLAHVARDREVRWVEDRWGETGDPAGRLVGFGFDLNALALPAGRHRLDVRAIRSDGRSWPIASEWIVIAR